MFERPGTYQVNLTVNDFQGNATTAFTTISVSDPEVVFHPSNGGYTWCVSNNGDFSGCPTSDPRYHISDYSQIFETATLCLGLGDSNNFYPPHGPRRVLLKRGQTHVGLNHHGACLPYTDGAYDSEPLMLAAFGQGPDPILQAPVTGQPDPQGYLFGYYAGPRAGTTVTGISFKGLYDASTGLGEYLGAGLLLWGDSLHNATIYRNTFSGFNLNVDLRSEDPSYAIIADNVSTNWQNFGFFGSVPYAAVLGNLIEQNPNTLAANWDGKGEWCRQNGICGSQWPDHGAMRVGQSTHLVLSYNNLTSRNSWIGYGAQPSLRFGSEGPNDVTHSIISHNRLMPGGGSGGDSGGNHLAAGNVTNVIWDSNQVILQQGDYYGNCFQTQFGGTLYQNNTCLKLPANREFPRFGASGFLQSMFVVLNPGPLNESTIAIPNRYYNNALISLDEKPQDQYTTEYDDAFLVVYAGGSTPTATPYRFDVKNNIVAAPQLANFISYWFYNHSFAQPPTGYPAAISAERNFFSVAQHRTSPDRYFNYPWDFWGPSGQGSNTTADPELASIPTACRPALAKQLDVAGATLSGDGLRSYVTKTGANFGGSKVLRGSYVSVASSSSGLHLYEGINVLGSSGDTITLVHDIRQDRTRSAQIDLKVTYSPSTASKIYVWDNSVFSVGNTVTYDMEATPRSVTAVGSDGEGQYVSISPSLADRATSYICKWAAGVTPGLNLHLAPSSPARDSGYAVPVFGDYNQTPRPSGLSWDVGVFEDE